MSLKSKPWQPAAAPAASERVLHWTPEVCYELDGTPGIGVAYLAAALFLAIQSVQAGVAFKMWSKDDNSPLLSWSGVPGQQVRYHRPELEKALIEVTLLFSNAQLALLRATRADLEGLAMFAKTAAQSTEAAAAAPEGASTGSETPPDSASDAPIDNVPATSEQPASEHSSADTAPTTNVTG